MKPRKIILAIIDFLGLLGVPVGLTLFTFFEAADDAATANPWGAVKLVGIITVLVLAVLLKKKKLDPYFNDVRHILNNHRADYEIETDETKREKLRRSINRRARLILVYDRISLMIPLLCIYLATSYIADSIDQLQSVIGFTMLSCGSVSIIDYAFNIEPSELDKEPEIPGAEE